MSEFTSTQREADPEFRTMVDLTSESLGRRIVVVSGDIDISGAPRLNERLIDAFKGPIDEVVVDLRGISFIDSSGLGVLVNARQRARSTGSRLKLVLPEGQARFPFEVTGLASLFDKQDASEIAELTATTKSD